MTMSRRGLGLVASTSPGAPALARAQAVAHWPHARPIRFIAPFAPVGTTDITARILAGEISRCLGHTMLVENRPGAGVALGTGQVPRRRPMAMPSCCPSPASWW